MGSGAHLANGINRAYCRSCYSNQWLDWRRFSGAKALAASITYFSVVIYPPRFYLGLMMTLIITTGL
jgi:hypothetical protein